ncbi:MAG: DUF2026 family protein, partial [Acetobacteraceae bacterium]
MASRPEDVAKPGTYWFEPNPELGRRKLGAILSMQANKDLLGICAGWYRRSPGKMRESTAIGNQRGETNEVPLSPVILCGAW